MTTFKVSGAEVTSARPMVSAILVLVLIHPALFAAVRGDATAYIGGTVLSLKPGQQGTLDLSDTRELRFHYKHGVYTVPYTRLTSLEFGQKVGRRVGSTIALGVTTLGVMAIPMLLSKKKKHYLTVGFKNDQGGDEVIVLELAKGVVRTTIPVLETRSGMKVEVENSGEVAHNLTTSRSSTTLNGPKELPVVEVTVPAARAPEASQNTHYTLADPSVDPASPAPIQGGTDDSQKQANPVLRGAPPESANQRNVSAPIDTRASITVLSEPVGAYLWVNGVAIGRSPMKFPIEPGIYRIILNRAGYQPWAQDIVVMQSVRTMEVKAEMVKTSQ